MKWIFTTILALWMVAGGHSCKAWKGESCIRRIECGFTRDTKTVKVRHKTSSEEEEIVAVCDWSTGNFTCDVAGGYRVTNTSPTTFNVSIDSAITCPNGNFTVTSNGEGHVMCTLDLDKSEQEALEPKEQNKTDCQENTEASADNKNRSKRSTEKKCPDHPSNKGNSWITPVVATVVTVLILIVIVVIALVVYSKRKRGRKNDIYVEVSLTPTKVIDHPFELEVPLNHEREMKDTPNV
ncbi:hypothetical protein C0Q70_12349 [Pomacea canaliculata]|uniref:Immunoglobulin subtype domain-containing protein n=1 Tax=Pomacea canaliculata TaxID=400727 RepID=A0A2T7P1A8_POMCA|nr:uncharacterized protein LOC112568082 isoform X2 [Pomacea canaliculata]PVD27195.1 hypothetical protein C0Q70_12349 [Pomacea canaliculata]